MFTGKILYGNPGKRPLNDREPQPRPAGDMTNDAEQSVRIVRETTDELTIEANLLQPKILLITDTWTPAWRAVPLPGSAQIKYDLLPADYILRAIPLAAGHHSLRMEYAPRAFYIGKWVSFVSLVCYGGLIGAVLGMQSRTRRRKA